MMSLSSMPVTALSAVTSAAGARTLDLYVPAMAAEMAALMAEYMAATEGTSVALLAPSDVVDCTRSKAVTRLEPDL